MQRQIAQDVLPHQGRGRGRKGAHHRPLRQPGDEFRNPQIGGPEILAPLGDTVGLVHRHEGDGQALAEVDEIGGRQPLRRHIEELELAGFGKAHRHVTFIRRQLRVQIGCGNAGCDERGHLIVHERHERTDHQREPGQHEGWNLVAQGLASSCRHKDEGVVSCYEMADDALLVGLEGVVPEEFFQLGVNGCGIDRHKRV